MGTCSTAKEFLQSAQETGATYEIETIFSEEGEVCVIFKPIMPQGLSFLTCGLYAVDKGKNRFLGLIFDASAFLEMSQEEN
jgi:hypothetical protein